MITGSAASPPTRTPPFGAAPFPGAATSGGRAELMSRGGAQVSAIDRITLTPAARLDLLMKDAGAQLRTMDELLLAPSGSVSDPATMDMHEVARLVQAARGLATAVEAARDANAIAVAKGLPGQAEQVVVLVAHASSTLQAVTVRLIKTQATACSALTGDSMAPRHNRDRASVAEAKRSVGDTGDESASRIAAGLQSPPAVAAALATVQGIATRMARLQTASPASGASWASQREGDAIRDRNGKVRRPMLPGLVCVLVALVLLQRIDPGPVQHIATVLALPMALAWCGHWLVRRRQKDSWRQMAWRQDGVASETLDVSMSITAAPGAGHATRAAPLA